MPKKENPLASKVLAYVLGHWSDYGYAPTESEIAENVGTSKGNAHYFVSLLVSAGKLKRTKRNRWRNIAPADIKD